MRDNIIETTRRVFKERRERMERERKSDQRTRQDAENNLKCIKKKRDSAPTVRVIGKNGKPIKVQMPISQEYDIYDCAQKNSENLIYVGGIAGYDEETKQTNKKVTFREFRERQNASLLNEKKNRSKRKKETALSDQRRSEDNARTKKIRTLQSTDQWGGLT